jgi:hypothetical protein
VGFRCKGFSETEFSQPLHLSGKPSRKLQVKRTALLVRATLFPVLLLNYLYGNHPLEKRFPLRARRRCLKVQQELVRPEDLLR